MCNKADSARRIDGVAVRAADGYDCETISFFRMRSMMPAFRMLFRLLLWSGLAAGVAGGSALAECRAEHETDVPITVANGYVFVPVTMNGETGRFLLDTGSAETFMDTGFAAKSGAGMDRHAGQFEYGGAGNKHTLPVFHGHIRITEVGKIRFQDWEYGIMDLSWMVDDGVHPDGILGMDFLHYFEAEVDFHAKTLTLYRLFSCGDIAPPWKKDFDAIPLQHTPNHNVTIPVFVDNALLNLEFDTGAGGGVLLTRDAAAKAGVDAAGIAKDIATRGTGIGGGFNVAHHRFGMFLVGSAVYKDRMLEIENERTEHGESDGLIGLAPLNAERVWLSFSTNTLFVQRASQVKPGP
jgi:predicted aspartyl protease